MSESVAEGGVPIESTGRTYGGDINRFGVASNVSGESNG